MKNWNKVDTRAYFTAATCAISLNKSLGVTTSSKSFSKFKNLNYSTNTKTSFKQITIWNKQLGISSMFFKIQINKYWKISY